MGSERILVVDDDEQICRFLARYLSREGFSILTASDGDAMREQLRQQSVDLVVLDLNMPGDDGLTLTRELRSNSELGIIILTGKESNVERIVGLELGADDYVSKPFDERELLARIRSVLRRSQPAAVTASSPVATHEVIEFAGWKLDVSSRTLVDEHAVNVPLTTLEFDMLVALVRQAMRVISRETLLRVCTGRDWDPYDRAVDTVMAKLRKKLEPDPKHPIMIKTIRGVGYMFAVPIKLR